MHRILFAIALCLTVAASGVAQESSVFRARVTTRVAPIDEGDGGGEVSSPISVTELLAEASTANATSYLSSGTFTVATNRLGLCFVFNTDGDADPGSPTSLTQTGQTWVEIVTTTNPHGDLRATVFRTLGLGAAAAAVTATFPGGDNQTGAIIICRDATNVPTSGTFGSGAIARVSGLGVDNSTTATATFSGRTLSTAVVFGAAITEACTWVPESGYTQGSEPTYATPTLEASTIVALTGGDTTPSAVLSGCGSAPDIASVAVEIAPNLDTDVSAPFVIINVPTNVDEVYETTDSTGFVFGGLTADNVGVTSVTWETTTGTTTPDSGTASLVDGVWGVTGVMLPCDANGETVIITATAIDAATNTGTDTLTVLCITPDDINPTIHIKAPTAGPSFATTTATQLIGGDVADETALAASPVTWECTTGTCTPDNGTATYNASLGSWTFTVALPCSTAPGTTSVITVTATDLAGNTNSPAETVSGTCTSGDITAPSIEITTNCGGGPGGNCTISTVPRTITGTASDNVPATMTVTASCTNATQSAPVVSGTTNWSFSLTPASGLAALCTVTVRDAGGLTAQDTITVTYIQDLSIATTSLSALVEDQVGQVRCVTAVGGVAPYIWDITAGALPTGMSLDGSVTSTECFDGIPTTAQAVNPTFRVRDSQGTPDSATQAISVTVNVPGATNGFTYFDTISALSTSMEFSACTVENPTGGCSLRAQAQLNRIKGSTPTNYSYNCTGATPANCASDPYTDRQEGAKFLWQEELANPPSSSQLRFNISQGTVGGASHDYSTGAYLVTFDMYFGAEWRPRSFGGNAPPLSEGYSHKEYQFALDPGGGGAGDAGDIYVELVHNFGGSGGPNLTSADVAHMGFRPYGACEDFNLDQDCADAEDTLPVDLGLAPTASYTLGNQTRGQGTLVQDTLVIKHSVWTRYWMYCKLNVAGSTFTSWNATYGLTVPPTGTYHDCSVWIADETRPLMRLAFGFPILRQKSNRQDIFYDELKRFWFEHNTSSGHFDATGPVTLTGTPGTVVPKKTKINRNSDSQQYTTLTAVAIAGSGSATVNVVASGDIAAAGNTSAGAAMTVVIPIAGLDNAVTVATGGIVGGAYLLAGDAVFYTRGFNVLKNPTLNLSGTTAAGDVVNNPTIFVQPVP